MWGRAYFLSLPGRTVGTERHRSCVIVGICFQIFGYCTAVGNVGLLWEKSRPNTFSFL